MLDEVRQSLRSHADPEKARLATRFFKAGPGQYGEGDKFLGITVPSIRLVAKRYYKTLRLEEVIGLLHSPWHEERLAAVIILVMQYKRGDEEQQHQIYQRYLANTKWINNWDLVDSSAEFIVGPWLDGKPEQMTILTGLAKSKSVWERRIAMLATFDYIKRGRADQAVAVASLLLHDEHDLIQKAVGWMIREIGKRVDRQIQLHFLDEFAATMPRTTLRYAIEHLDNTTRVHYLTRKQ